MGDEDCLTLNVWTPIDPGTEPLPVVFWIHGGGNFFGAANLEADGLLHYSGHALAANGPAVVVSLQYRLGALGYLTHPSIEGAEGTSGNYGTKDIVLALEWVHDNIAAFGGDPGNVMVFGESAGAQNTCLMLFATAEKELLHSAAMMSGGCRASSRESMVEQSERLLEALECGGADARACLGALSPEELVRATSSDGARAGDTRWQPHVDGAVIADRLETLFVADKYRKVPMIFGTTADEATTTLQYWFSSLPQSEEELGETVAKFIQRDDVTDEILSFYSEGSLYERLVRIISDIAFHCPTNATAASFARNQEQPVYRYVWSNVLEDSQLSALGAGHGMELPYVFDNLRVYEPLGYQPTESDQELARASSGGWLDLAREGVVSTLDWPMVEGHLEAEAYLNFDETISVSSGYRKAQCDFWRDLAAN
jgi:para-nitrobenzyl esterase